MIFLPDNRQPKPYYTKRMHLVGKFNVTDGIIDITDPCYEKDTWCAMFDVKIKPGTYYCYIDMVNFPSLYTEENNNEIKRIEDERIMTLTIKHEEFIEKPLKRWININTNICVDAGLCGFYNHKPNFEKENDWLAFCNNLKTVDGKFATCDLRPYGITVSSGFGDGCYSAYKSTKENEIIALQLRFD